MSGTNTCRKAAASKNVAATPLTFSLPNSTSTDVSITVRDATATSAPRATDETTSWEPSVRRASSNEITPRMETTASSVLRLTETLTISSLRIQDLFARLQDEPMHRWPDLVQGGELPVELF